ncbi:Protein of unknown function [Pyronema omphalodes CBS 100304]|uniref:Uncharacterized protein n=1 Tax=Pyronema omphalodes (strain CBS 100304) TaxID=1076935 RepID=U4L1I6_PYROM|nr:Protein of unknown function [Pyronema omphalodes CBS 100304]
MIIQIKEGIAENDQKMKETLDECLKDNEKRMQEHEEKVQGQADHILASARHIEQVAHKAVNAHAVVLGEINYCISPHHETPANHGLRISRP